MPHGVHQRRDTDEKPVVFQTLLSGIESDITMRIKLLASVLVLSSALLTACQTITSSNRVIVSSAENWALLPITNLSSTPLAGNRASALVETHLRARGVKNLEIYKAPANQSVIALLDEAGQLNDAKQWARQNGFRYGITGDVQEWAYKNGLDNEPSIGMTLKFVDLQSEEVLWTASATRTGWGYSNLASTANKTIEELLTRVRFDANSRGRPVLAAAKDGSSQITSGVPASGNPGSNRPTAPIRPALVNPK